MSWKDASCAELILQEMKHRKIAFVDRFAPTFIGAVGAHIISIDNHYRADKHKIDIDTIMETKDIMAKLGQDTDLVELDELLAQKDEKEPVAKIMSLKEAAAKPTPDNRKDEWRKDRRKEVIDKTMVADGYKATQYPEFDWERDFEVGRPLFMQHGSAADMRCHVIMVAPSGAGKNLFIQQFADAESGFLKYTPLRPVWEGSMTEAGLAGTVTKKGDDYKFIPGEAAVHPKSIYGVEEMHAITGMMEGAHSLLEQFLMALDSGRVVKRLAGGKIRYKTYLTLLTGSQPGENRLKIDSGIARRFLFIFFAPSPDEWNTIYDAAFDAVDVFPNQIRTEIIRTKIEDIIFRVQRAKELRVDKEAFRDFGKENNIPHYEMSLIIKLAIGWTVMSQDFVDIIEVKLTDDIKRLCIQQARWRMAIKFGSSIAQVKAVLVASDGHMKRTDLIDHMVTYHSLSAKQVESIIAEMRKYSILNDTFKVDTVTLKGMGEKTKEAKLDKAIDKLNKKAKGLHEYVGKDKTNTVDN